MKTTTDTPTVRATIVGSDADALVDAAYEHCERIVMVEAAWWRHNKVKHKALTDAANQIAAALAARRAKARGGA